MKLDHHIRKIKRIENTIKKLDINDDSETLIEDYMLVSAHYLNAAMHKLGTVREDKDIKHNRLFGFIKNENALKDNSLEVALLVEGIEQLRPSYVYGKGEDPNAVLKAKDNFEKIRDVCKKILENETEHQDSN